MIPIKDTIRSRSFPLVTWTLIILNVLVFIYETNLSAAGLNRLFNTYGLVANHIVWSNPATWYPFFTHMFLHGGWMHLFFNMLALVMFGAPLEYTWGERRYLTYYLVCVVGAGLCQLGVGSWAVASGTDPYPTIGASGGVFGLLLAYGMLFPNQRVMLLFPPIPMKARTLVILYGLFELGVGLTGLQPGVAHFAHLGGMLFGWLLIRYWRGQPPFGGSKPKPPMRIVR